MKATYNGDVPVKMHGIEFVPGEPVEVPQFGMVADKLRDNQFFTIEDDDSMDVAEDENARVEARVNEVKAKMKATFDDQNVKLKEAREYISELEAENATLRGGDTSKDDDMSDDSNVNKVAADKRGGEPVPLDESPKADVHKEVDANFEGDGSDTGKKDEIDAAYSHQPEDPDDDIDGLINEMTVEELRDFADKRNLDVDKYQVKARLRGAIHEALAGSEKSNG